MRVLFVTEPFSVEPLGMAYLSAALKEKGHITEQIRTTDDPFLDKVEAFKPDVVAFSVTTGKHRKALELNRLIKQRCKVLSVFGGSHPTYFPGMSEEEGVDAIIRGEADKAFPALLKEYELKKSVPKITEFAELEQNLDSLPLPDRNFLYKYPENAKNPIKNVMTSRGCRFSCPYCFNSLYRSFYKGQNWVRHRSANNVLKELSDLKRNHNAKFIFFQDDEFLTNPHFESLMTGYANRIKLPFHCQLRIELLTADKALFLKSAGCTGVTFAVECGDIKQRKEVLKRYMSDQQILGGVDFLKRFKIKIRTENMVGLPGETLDMMFKTLEINQKIQPTIAWASIFQPYPCIPLGEMAREKGLWDGKDAFKESFFEDTCLRTDIRRQIVTLQRLFGVFVHYKTPLKAVEKIINLPPNKGFDFMYRKWKNKCYRELFR
jgi:anaerobic magnesium-protoporphyrin IX monomethyl ester cyclase